MKTIITIAGTNSQKSINKQLLSYTSDQLEQFEIISIDLNDYVLPIFGVDYEDENGIPTAAKRLSELLDSADGFIVALAEHNGTYTAVFKNTIDWLSRANIKIWRDKPMLLLATSPGDKGGKSVLNTAVTSFPFIGGKIIANFSLPSFYKNFSNGEVNNAQLKEDLAEKTQLLTQHLNSK